VSQADPQANELEARIANVPNAAEPVGCQSATEQDRIAPTTTVEAEREVAFYAAVVNGWLETRMEKDRSLLSISGFAIAALVAYLTTKGPHTRFEAVMSGISLLAFAGCCCTAVAIFHSNADALEALAICDEGRPSAEARLRRFDRLLLTCFVIGLVSVVAVGLELIVRSPF
jgi:hypothetical protein